MAPESVLERKYSTSSDVWSFGVLMWEVYSRGDKPFENHNINTVTLAIVSGARLKRPDGCPVEVFAGLMRLEFMLADMKSCNRAGSLRPRCDLRSSSSLVSCPIWRNSESRPNCFYNFKERYYNDEGSPRVNSRPSASSRGVPARPCQC
jgi:serine/threonine protein kinase